MNANRSKGVPFAKTQKFCHNFCRSQHCLMSSTTTDSSSKGGTQKGIFSAFFKDDQTRKKKIESRIEKELRMLKQDSIARNNDSTWNGYIDLANAAKTHGV